MSAKLDNHPLFELKARARETRTPALGLRNGLSQPQLGQPRLLNLTAIVARQLEAEQTDGDDAVLPEYDL